MNVTYLRDGPAGELKMKTDGVKTVNDFSFLFLNMKQYFSVL